MLHCCCAERFGLKLRIDGIFFCRVCSPDEVRHLFEKYGKVNDVYLPSKFVKLYLRYWMLQIFSFCNHSNTFLFLFAEEYRKFYIALGYSCCANPARAPFVERTNPRIMSQFFARCFSVLRDELSPSIQVCVEVCRVFSRISSQD